MKTLALVILLMGLSAAAGLSLLIDAGAQPRRGVAGEDVPRVELSQPHACAPDPLPSDVDTLLTCIFKASNTGGQAVSDVRLTFAASSGDPLPDAYYFFAATVTGPDGATEALAVHANLLDYPMGDLPPGGEATIEVAVIVRSSHEYGASVLLFSGSQQLDVLTLSSDVGASGPAALSVRAAPVEGQPTGTFDIVVENHTDQPIENAFVDVAHGPEMEMHGATRYRPGVPNHVTTTINTLGANGVVVSRVAFQPNAAAIAAYGGRCGFLLLAVVVVADPPSVGPQRAAAIAEDGASFDECYPAGGDVVLPAGGVGPDDRDGSWPMRFGAAFAISGALLASMGIRVRRKQRPSRAGG